MVSPTTALRCVAFAAASISLAALLAQVFGVLPMGSFLTFLGVPSLLLLFTLAALARWLDQRIFVTCLTVGALGGLVATVAYDLIRLAMRGSGLFDYDGFKAIYLFGSWISGRPVGTWHAAVAGWGYHFWNGVSFGIFYTLMFGRARWWYGVLYGLVMEACMLGLFPVFLHITDKVDFIVLSLVGHLGYGAVLGAAAQRYALDWRPVRPRRRLDRSRPVTGGGSHALR
ncbi:MAG TPA: DUF6789 family protein [Methylomirabilota bacterium]|jgi:hypothetical protein|nr:DUF6789 family protein [Methylomirabilota bacterium]